MYSQRCHACVPMSPIQPAFPERFGSQRQPALFPSKSSILSESHPWVYSAYIRRNVPNSPFGGNYKGHSVKNGKNPKDIAKRRAKNKNKKTHRM